VTIEAGPVATVAQMDELERTLRPRPLERVDRRDGLLQAAAPREA